MNTIRPNLITMRLMATGLASKTRFSLLALSLVGVVTLQAQKAAEDPPPASALGPQSGLEQYDAPVAPFEQLEGLIDFPALINAPGANDDAQVTPSLRGLQLEIMGTSGARKLGNFVTIQGATRADEATEALYDALYETLRVYRDLPLTLGELRFLQQDIAEAYRESGFPLMAVVVPPQEIVDGVVRVQINEFSLRQYRVQFGTGDGSYAEDAEHWTDRTRLGNLLDPLLREPILTKTSLDAKVKALNLNPARSARVIFEPGQQLGESIAIFQIDEQRTWGLQAGYNNHATESSGTHRFSVGGSFTNVLLENHQLSWNAVTGTDIEEFKNYSVIYTIPNRWGHRLTANVNFSDTASSAVPPVGSASTTLQSSLKYDIPLLKTEKWNWNLSVLGAFKQFERESLFGEVVVGGAQFDGAQLVINNTFNVKEATATNQIVLGVALAFDGISGHNTDADFRQFYNYTGGEAATQHLILNYARVQQLGPLVAALEGWSAETQLSGQFTSDQLAGSDTFALGGATVLRAYQASEVFGDAGFYAVQTLQMPPWQKDALGALGRLGVDQLSLSAFVEMGRGQPEVGVSQSLWDVGLKASISAAKRLQASASVAFAGEATRQTERGDARFFLSASMRY